MDHRRSKQPSALLIVYDGDCILCRRSVRWLQDRKTFVPISYVTASSAEAVDRFGHTAEYGQHMIVAANDGRVWVGAPDAYLTVMWAVRRLRLASYLMSMGPFKPLARRAFQAVSGNRHVIGGWVGEGCTHCTAV